MTPIERIARRIEPLAWIALGTGDTAAHAARRAVSLVKARDVLEELREPTPDMVHNGAHAVLDTEGPSGEVAEAVFRAMIDTALAEGEAP